jgi:CDP-glucose 4,6-dehydratase
VSWQGRRVLVTGHTGFKGAWLALWLHRLGARVSGLSTDPPTTPSLFDVARVSAVMEADVRADVRDREAVRAAVTGAAPEVVFHLAAQALVRPALEDPGPTFATNVLGTAHVLDATRGAAAIVVVTSDKCYRPNPDGAPHRESDPLGGEDPYSASKAAQEHVAASYRLARGLPLATVRAGNVIGGGDWAADRLVPDLVRGGRVAIRHPDAVRPWQHVLNPLSGYLRVAEGLLAGEPLAEAWNFGPDTADERPVRWLVEHWPAKLDVAAGAPEQREAAVLRLSSEKAGARLSWRPRWDLSAGLRATYDWHAAVDAGADPRDVTLEQIEEFEGT